MVMLNIATTGKQVLNPKPLHPNRFQTGLQDLARFDWFWQCLMELSSAFRV